MQYCGPGKFTAKTNKRMNAICKKHDEGYGNIIKNRGYLDAYLWYNEADAEMLDQMSMLGKRYRDWVYTGAEKYFRAKKRFLNRNPTSLGKRYGQLLLGYDAPAAKRFRSESTALVPYGYKFRGKFPRTGSFGKASMSGYAKTIWKKKRSYKNKNFVKLSRGMKKAIASVVKNPISQPSFKRFHQTFAQVSSGINTTYCGELSLIGDASSVDSNINAMPFRAFTYNSAGNFTLTQDQTGVTFAGIEGYTVAGRVKDNIQMRNNWNVPADLEYWIFEAKADLDLALNADTLWAAIGDKTLIWSSTQYDGTTAAFPITNGPTDDDDAFFVNPESCKDLMKCWKLISKGRVRLDAGDEKNFRLDTGWFRYSPEQLDLNSSFRYFKGATKTILVRLKGGLGHDVTTTSNVAIGPAKLDVRSIKTYEYKYPRLDYMADMHQETGTYNAATSVEFDVAAESADVVIGT